MKLRLVERKIVVKDIDKPIKDENVISTEDLEIKEMEVDRENLAIMYANTSFFYKGKLRQIAGKYYDVDNDAHAIMIYNVISE